MNTKYIFVVAAMAVMLIGATAFATDSVFADGKKKYGKSQAISQVNECGNYWFPVNIICSNLSSQAQGNENYAGLAAATSDSQRTDSGKNYGTPFP